MADIRNPNPLTPLTTLDRIYARYAGFYTEKMRQRAIEGGCQTVAEMEEWFDVNYSRDQNHFNRPLRYPGRKIPFAGRAAKLHKIRLIP